MTATATGISIGEMRVEWNLVQCFCWQRIYIYIYIDIRLLAEVRLHKKRTNMSSKMKKHIHSDKSVHCLTIERLSLSVMCAEHNLIGYLEQHVDAALRTN